jgi:hypothetical protein
MGVVHPMEEDEEVEFAGACKTGGLLTSGTHGDEDILRTRISQTMVTSQTLVMTMLMMLVALIITSMANIISIIILFISTDRLFIPLLKIADTSGKVIIACLSILMHPQLRYVFSVQYIGEFFP